MLGLPKRKTISAVVTSCDQKARESRSYATSRDHEPLSSGRGQRPNMTTAHVDQDNLKLIQQGFELFAAGDMAALTKLFHADADWHEAPKGVIVGNYHGRDAIFGFFGRLHQETAGTLRANVLSMAATGDQVFVRSEVTGQRLGNSLNADHVQIFTIADGQVTDVLVYSADHPAEAAFWS